jgi:hypothetical protein
MVYGDRSSLLPGGVIDSITVAQAVLQRVVAKLGDAAASQLGVTQAAFALFLNGTEALPDRVLLRAVDIVLEELQHIPSAESLHLNRAELQS